MKSGNHSSIYSKVIYNSLFAIIAALSGFSNLASAQSGDQTLPRYYSEVLYKSERCTLQNGFEYECKIEVYTFHQGKRWDLQSSYSVDWRNKKSKGLNRAIINYMARQGYRPCIQYAIDRGDVGEIFMVWDLVDSSLCR